MNPRFKVGDRVRARFAGELTIRHAGRGQYSAANDNGVIIGPFTEAYCHEHWLLVAWAPPDPEQRSVYTFPLPFGWPAPTGEPQCPLCACGCHSAGDWCATFATLEPLAVRRARAAGLDPWDHAERLLKQGLR